MNEFKKKNLAELKEINNEKNNSEYENYIQTPSQVLTLSCRKAFVNNRIDNIQSNRNYNDQKVMQSNSSIITLKNNNLKVIQTASININSLKDNNLYKKFKKYKAIMYKMIEEIEIELFRKSNLNINNTNININKHPTNNKKVTKEKSTLTNQENNIYIYEPKIFCDDKSEKEENNLRNVRINYYNNYNKSMLNKKRKNNNKYDDFHNNYNYTNEIYGDFN